MKTTRFRLAAGLGLAMLAFGSTPAAHAQTPTVVSPEVTHTGTAPTGYAVTFRISDPTATRMRIRGEWFFSGATTRRRPVGRAACRRSRSRATSRSPTRTAARRPTGRSPTWSRTPTASGRTRRRCRPAPTRTASTATATRRRRRSRAAPGPPIRATRRSTRSAASTRRGRADQPGLRPVGSRVRHPGPLAGGAQPGPRHAHRPHLRRPRVDEPGRPALRGRLHAARL